jgi:thioredoxin reductase (NADPH)
MVQALRLRDVNTRQLSSLDVAGVFVAVGLVPNNKPFAGILQLSETGHIVTDELLATSVPGIYAAGDIRKNSPRQIVSAVGDGATAALSVLHYPRG